MKRKIVYFLSAVAVVAAVGVGLRFTQSDSVEEGVAPVVLREAVARPAAEEEKNGYENPREPTARETEERLVVAFHDLTDRWVQSSEKRVSLTDVDEFVRVFRRLPKARKDECIHRALNLIPDGNVMLLAGVLMDRSVDRGIVNTVFNDILNRSEEVKKPILQQIYKDRNHPCWVDAAWILDATGERPDK